MARGKLLLKMNKPHEALADFTTIILRFPKDWKVRQFSAEAYRQAGDLQNAEHQEKVARELQIAEQVQLGATACAHIFFM